MGEQEQMRAHQEAMTQYQNIQAQQAATMAERRQGDAMDAAMTDMAGNAGQAVGADMMAPSTAATLGKYGYKPRYNPGSPTVYAPAQTQMRSMKVAPSNITVHNHNQTIIQGNNNNPSNFKLWLERMLASQKEAAKRRNTEYDKRESSLAKSANKALKKIEQTGINVATTFSPSKIGQSIGNQFRILLFLIGGIFIKKYWKNLVSGLHTASSKIEDIANYFGFTKNGRDKAAQGGGFYNDLVRFLGGDPNKPGENTLLGIGRIWITELGDYLAKKMQHMASLRGEAIKAIKFPEINLADIGSTLSGIGKYLGNILTALVDPKSAMHKSISNNIHTIGKDRSMKVSENKRHRDLRAVKDTDVGDYDHQVVTKGKRNYSTNKDYFTRSGELREGPAAQMSQSMDILGAYKDASETGLIDTARAAAGWERLKNSAKKRGIVTVDKEFVDKFVSPDLYNQLLARGGIRPAEYKYVRVKRTDAEKWDEEGAADFGSGFLRGYGGQAAGKALKKTTGMPGSKVLVHGAIGNSVDTMVAGTLFGSVGAGLSAGLDARKANRNANQYTLKMVPIDDPREGILGDKGQLLTTTAYDLDRNALTAIANANFDASIDTSDKAFLTGIKRSLIQHGGGNEATMERWINFSGSRDGYETLDVDKSFEDMQSFDNLQKAYKSEESMMFEKSHFNTAVNNGKGVVNRGVERIGNAVLSVTDRAKGGVSNIFHPTSYYVGNDPVVEDNGGEFHVQLAADTAIRNTSKNLVSGGSKSDRKSIEYCARYVRHAVQSGLNRKPLSGWRNGAPAKEYVNILPKNGFAPVNWSGYIPKLGDIVVMPQVKNHEYGHICINTSKGWVSDFIQSDVWPAAEYREAACATAFRHIHPVFGGLSSKDNDPGIDIEDDVVGKNIESLIRQQEEANEYSNGPSLNEKGEVESPRRTIKGPFTTTTTAEHNRIIAAGEASALYQNSPALREDLKKDGTSYEDFEAWYTNLDEKKRRDYQAYRQAEGFWNSLDERFRKFDFLPNGLIDFQKLFVSLSPEDRGLLMSNMLEMANIKEQESASMMADIKDPRSEMLRLRKVADNDNKVGKLSGYKWLRYGLQNDILGGKTGGVDMYNALVTGNIDKATRISDLHVPGADNGRYWNDDVRQQWFANRDNVYSRVLAADEYKKLEDEIKGFLNTETVKGRSMESRATNMLRDMEIERRMFAQQRLADGLVSIDDVDSDTVKLNKRKANKEISELNADLGKIQYYYDPNDKDSSKKKHKLVIDGKEREVAGFTDRFAEGLRAEWEAGNLPSWVISEDHLEAYMNERAAELVKEYEELQKKKQAAVIRFEKGEKAAKEFMETAAEIIGSTDLGFTDTVGSYLKDRKNWEKLGLSAKDFDENGNLIASMFSKARNKALTEMVKSGAMTASSLASKMGWDTIVNAKGERLITDEDIESGKLGPSIVYHKDLDGKAYYTYGGKKFSEAKAADLSSAISRDTALGHLLDQEDFINITRARKMGNVKDPRSQIGKPDLVKGALSRPAWEKYHLLNTYGYTHDQLIDPEFMSKFVDKDNLFYNDIKREREQYLKEWNDYQLKDKYSDYLVGGKNSNMYEKTANVKLNLASKLASEFKTDAEKYSNGKEIVTKGYSINETANWYENDNNIKRYLQEKVGSASDLDVIRTKEAFRVAGGNLIGVTSDLGNGSKALSLYDRFGTPIDTIVPEKARLAVKGKFGEWLSDKAEGTDSYRARQKELEKTRKHYQDMQLSATQAGVEASKGEIFMLSALHEQLEAVAKMAAGQGGGVVVREMNRKEKRTARKTAATTSGD